jgi:predicted DNA-binding transcriptional regulator YafY
VLTLGDMAAMLWALKGVRSSLPAREIDQAIEKVGSLVPRDRRGELELMGEQVALDMTGWAFDEGRRETLRRLHEAIRTARLVAFTYRNLRGQTERRVVEPMTLLYKGSAWYLFGWCRLKSAYRLFHTRRMSDLEVRLKTFRRRAATYRDYLSPSEEPPNTAELVLRFPASHRLKVEELFPREAITAEGRHLIVRVRYPEDEWVHSFLLGMGDRVEVLEPAGLRRTLRDTIRRMAEVYEGPNQT